MTIAIASKWVRVNRLVSLGGCVGNWMKSYLTKTGVFSVASKQLVIITLTRVARGLVSSGKWQSAKSQVYCAAASSGLIQSAS